MSLSPHAESVHVVRLLSSTTRAPLTPSETDPDFDNFTGFDRPQRRKGIADMRPNVIQIVRERTNHQQSQISSWNVLLVLDVLVDGNQNIKLFVRECE